MQEQEAKLETLRAALIEGEKSGPSTAFDFDEFITRKTKVSNETPSHQDAKEIKPS